MFCSGCRLVYIESKLGLLTSAVLAIFERRHLPIHSQRMAALGACIKQAVCLTSASPSDICTVFATTQVPLDQVLDTCQALREQLHPLADANAITQALDAFWMQKIKLEEEKLTDVGAHVKRLLELLNSEDSKLLPTKVSIVEGYSIFKNARAGFCLFSYAQHFHRIGATAIRIAQPTTPIDRHHGEWRGTRRKMPPDHLPDFR